MGRIADLSPGELAILASDGRQVQVRIEVQNGSGTWIDYSAYATGVDWGEDPDTPVWNGQFTFARANGDNSLAPFDEDSPLNVDDLAAYSPAIDGMRRARLFTVIYDPDVGFDPFVDESDTGDFKKVFDGYLVDIDSQLKNIVAEAQDLGAPLLFTQIKEERTYGGTPATLVRLDVVIQQILDDNMGVGLYPLVTPVLPNWFLGKYKQDRVKVMDAIRTLAQQIGWEVRMMWNSSGEMELRLFEPDRAKTAPDYTWVPSYWGVPGFKVPTSDIVNAARVFYFEAGTKLQRSVYAEVPSSIAQYKYRYGEIREASSSNIDSEVEATALVNALLSDVAKPKATFGMSTRYFWPAELGDLYEFAAHKPFFTTAQNQAPVTIRHSITRATASTSFTTRGTVVGLYRNWKVKLGEAAPPSAPAPRISATRMWGEASIWRGQLLQLDGEDDGECGATVVMPKNVRQVYIYVKEGDEEAGPILLPPKTDSNLASILTRPEGETPQGDPELNGGDWVTGFMVPTLPDFPRAVLLLPEGYDGQLGPEIGLVQYATNATGIDVPPDYDSASVTRLAPDEVSIAVTVSSVPIGFFSFIVRDGIRIAHIFHPSATAASYLFVDRGLDPSKSYKYWIFPFHSGIDTVTGLVNARTGWRFLQDIDPWESSLLMAFPVADVAGDPAEPFVHLEWTDDGSEPTIDHYVVQKSMDGGRVQPWKDVSPDIASTGAGTYTWDDRDYWPNAFYRVVGYDSLDGFVDISYAQHWNGEGI